MIKIPCLYMRAGTSKALFLNKADLPTEKNERDKILLKLMGSAEINQIDGLGNGDPLTNKVALVCKSERNDADLDYLFAQIIPSEKKVSTEANCGNILSGVAPFAIIRDIIPTQKPTTHVKIYNENTKTVVQVTIETPNGKVTHEGDTCIDGVPGTGSPIQLNFPDSVGSTFGTPLPTEKPLNQINGIKFSLIDVAVPVIMAHASDFGITGQECPDILNKNQALLSSIRSFRNDIIERFHLNQSLLLPKVALLSDPRSSGNLSSRYFTPFTCHSAHAITGGLCLAAACFIEGSIANQLYTPMALDESLVIEHPAGKLRIDMKLASLSPFKIKKASFIRTARPLFDGFGIIAA